MLIPMMRAFITFLVAFTHSAFALEPPPAFPLSLEDRQRVNEAFGNAREREEKQETAAAFRAYLGIPGGEFAAARLARTHVEMAKAELGKLEAGLPSRLMDRSKKP